MARNQQFRIRRLTCGRGSATTPRGFVIPVLAPARLRRNGGGQSGTGLVGWPRARRGLGRLVVRARSAVADAGMATAEYAVGTLAAAGFAALLFAILRGGEMKSLLLGIMKRALSV